MTMRKGRKYVTVGKKERGGTIWRRGSSPLKVGGELKLEGRDQKGETMDAGGPPKGGASLKRGRGSRWCEAFNDEGRAGLGGLGVSERRSWKMAPTRAVS
jgi:hypothetical protein